MIKKFSRLPSTTDLFVGPTGIEPVPLVLQTSVRTSYTKDPYEGECANFSTDPVSARPGGTRTHSSFFVGSSGLEPLP